jgi:hypothetical protein
VGFDRLIILDGRDEPCRDPERIAALAADWIRADGGCDCVFLGQMDSVCCEMSVPGRLAGKLGLPCIGFVADLDWQGDGFRVKRRAADGWLSAETEARGVYGFYNAAHAYLRMATLREKLKVSGRTPETAPTPAPAPTGQELLSLRYGMRERHCRFLEETEPEKAAAAVLRWMRGEESAHA